MNALTIEILNPKALQLLNGMEDLKLIKLGESPKSTLQAYLKKTRRNGASAPSEDEIAKIVEEVRTKRQLAVS